MDNSRPVRPAQFSLWLLFVAVTTCAAAFAVLFQGPTTLLGMFAACVPFFWLARASILAGEALRGRRHWLAEDASNLLVVLGVVLCAAIAIYAAALCLYFLLTVWEYLHG